VVKKKKKDPDNAIQEFFIIAMERTGVAVTGGF
jgi:hypothetical protein